MSERADDVERLRTVVAELEEICRKGGQLDVATRFRNALSGRKADRGLISELSSSEIWGPAGSVVDQAFVEVPKARSDVPADEFHKLRMVFIQKMIHLGETLLKLQFRKDLIRNRVQDLKSLARHTGEHG